MAYQFLRAQRKDRANYEDEEVNQGATPKLTYEQYCEAVRCHRIHTDTPQLTDLARAWGISKGTVTSSVRRRIKRYDIRMQQEKT